MQGIASYKETYHVLLKLDLELSLYNIKRPAEFLG